MKYRTLNNWCNAIDLVMDKGYPIDDAEVLCDYAFERCREHKYDRPVEWFINLIMPYDEWLKQYGDNAWL